ncbi:MAG TPA: FtsX-like permease family protein, partial [Thermoanaerobaculia bacterium]|nr:FtsX-like permease family protein [Thermoanaerobaculia bacterium]
LDLEEPADVYVPLETWVSGRGAGGAATLSERRRERYMVIARLQRGVSVASANAAVTAVAARHAAERDPDRGPVSAGVEAPRGWVPPGHLGEILPLAAIGFAATGVVLLVAAANVANLLLARGTLRRREIGIRLAIGASRGRLVRQLLTESVLLAAFGTAAGVLLSSWLVDVALARFDAPGLLRPVLDGRMLAYAVAASLATGILFGLAPAWTSARHRLGAALRESGTGASPAGRRFQSALVVSQLALSLVLLAAGGLLLRSLVKAGRVPVGFDRDTAGDVLTVSFDPATQGYSPEKARRFREDLLERARALPGVRAAALTEVVPLGRRAISEDYAPEGAAPDAQQHAFLTSTSPGYLATMGIALVAGRDFRPGDREGAPRIAIVNETFARRAWPGRSPVGQRFAVATDPAARYEVIGVASDGKYVNLTEEPLPFVYFSIAQETHLDDAVLMVRTSAGSATAAALRAAVKELDPSMPLFRSGTLAASLEEKAGDRRAGTLILAFFGGLALVLAAVGLYGVVALAVGARRREIGIRIALGASRREVVRLFLRQGARLTAAGLAAGLLISAAATRLLSGFLFGVTPMDLTALGGVSALLGAVALAASALPALRAASTDPVEALRHE